MAKYLVIVESPTKAKTIMRILGKDYNVLSSGGHVRDLPKSKLGVDVEKDFQPQYKMLPKAKPYLTKLKEESAKAGALYLATDFDREGEAIAWHLAEYLKILPKNIKRITFHEITTQAIQEAIKNPRKINLDLVNAQQTRRILDRLVGYKISPILWNKVRRGLSAGRVQSVALRLICEREDEINRFKPQEYWSLQAELKKKTKETAFLAMFIEKDGKKYAKMDLANKEETDKIIEGIKGASWQVAGVVRKEKKRSPYPPFMTSTLQQAGSHQLGFTAKKTMMVAQSLYEGIDLGEDERPGLITYMRTDSLQVAGTAQKEALAFIEKEYGKKFLPPNPRVYKTKMKTAQEAHEAIRPTLMARTPASIEKYLTPDQFKLYRLIWRRFLASQMADAIFDTIAAEIKAGNTVFRASGQTVKFPGFLSLYKEEEDNSEKEEKTLPVLEAGELLDLVQLLPEQHSTEPPPRYNEASLIKILEEKGIGRPSTYAPIITTLSLRGYVIIKERRFFPTGIGGQINKIMIDHFPSIVDINFTANMEEQLDDIAVGKLSWTEVLKNFYGPFSRTLTLAAEQIEKVKPADDTTDDVCSLCQAPMVIKNGRFGRFLSCSRYPECKNKVSLDREGNKKPPPEPTDQKCEKCGKMMLRRIGKRGPFLACSGFPQCRNIKKIVVVKES
ncbi:MAG: type I DNA topoisomerase [Elusimicrobiota bacterium]